MARNPDLAASLAPPVTVVDWMRAHVAQIHPGAVFDPDRDVYVAWSEQPAPDQPPPWQDAVFIWDAALGEVSCRLPDCSCPVATPLGVAQAQVERFRRVMKAGDPAYQPFLHGAASVEERDHMIDLVDSGQAAAAIRDVASKRDLERARHKTPEAQARAGRIQAFLLDYYEQHGNRDDALWALVQLHQDDLARYREITGSDQVLKAETIRKEYWQRIPLADRQAARARYRGSQAEVPG